MGNTCIAYQSGKVIHLPHLGFHFAISLITDMPGVCWCADEFGKQSLFHFKWNMEDVDRSYEEVWLEVRMAKLLLVSQLPKTLCQGPGLDSLPLASLRISKYPQKEKSIVECQCQFTTLFSAFKNCFWSFPLAERKIQ